MIEPPDRFCEPMWGAKQRRRVIWLPWFIWFFAIIGIISMVALGSRAAQWGRKHEHANRPRLVGYAFPRRP